MKVHQTIVWHEFGHIFGYILVDKIYNDYRRIAKINLTEGVEKPQIVPNRKDNEPTDTEEKELIKEILFFVMGAVFHITKFKENEEIKFGDFSKIFTNVQYELNVCNLYGHAGSDFFKICEFNSNNLDKTSVIKFAFDLQSILQKHSIFNQLKPYATLFDDKYNGKKSEEEDLFTNERKEIYNLISKELIEEVKKLIQRELLKKQLLNNKKTDHN